MPLLLLGLELQRVLSPPQLPVVRELRQSPFALSQPLLTAMIQPGLALQQVLPPTLRVLP